MNSAPLTINRKGVTFKPAGGVDEPIYDAIFSTVPNWIGEDKSNPEDDLYAAFATPEDGGNKYLYMSRNGGKNFRKFEVEEHFDYVCGRRISSFWSQASASNQDPLHEWGIERACGVRTVCVRCARFANIPSWMVVVTNLAATLRPPLTTPGRTPDC
jgi:hypothetical protein